MQAETLTPLPERIEDVSHLESLLSKPTAGAVAAMSRLQAT
jgi:hypothetical protein